jgi:AcrR family transcriptional regulator
MPYIGLVVTPSASNPRSIPDGRHGLPEAYAVRSQRERLREAMVRVAAAKGYEATTVTDVIEVAGVSRSTFHEMFPDKGACFLEAYDAVIDVLVAHVTSAYDAAEGRPWPDRIIAALTALVDLLSAESDIARMAMVEITAAGEDARERYRAALARFTPLLEAGREYSGQDDELPPDTARFAVGGATSLIFDEVRAGRGPELRAALPDLAFAVLMPYIGSEAAEAEMRKIPT